MDASTVTQVTTLIKVNRSPGEHFDLGNLQSMVNTFTRCLLFIICYAAVQREYKNQGEHINQGEYNNLGNNNLR